MTCARFRSAGSSGRLENDELRPCAEARQRWGHRPRRPPSRRVMYPCQGRASWSDEKPVPAIGCFRHSEASAQCLSPGRLRPPCIRGGRFAVLASGRRALGDSSSERMARSSPVAAGTDAATQPGDPLGRETVSGHRLGVCQQRLACPSGGRRCRASARSARGIGSPVRAVLRRPVDHRRGAAGSAGRARLAAQLATCPHSRSRSAARHGARVGWDIQCCSRWAVLYNW